MAGYSIANLQRGIPFLFILWLGSLAGLSLRAEESTSPPTRAPNQHQQPLYLSTHPSLFTIPNAERAFEENVYPHPEFLPRDVYDAHPPIQFDVVPADEEAAEADSRIELMQYPTDDSAARDEDPDGHYSEPRWNPFPFLTEQMAKIPQDQRGVVWKEVATTVTELPQRADSYGMTVLDLRTTVYLAQLPFFQLTPRYGWRFLTGPGSTDLPPQLYDAGVDATLFLPLSSRWSFLGMVGPNIFTDGRNTSSEAFRMNGRALAFYQWTDTIKLSAGFLYLGRADITALPAGGFFYKPNDYFKAEIFFPKPKIGYRFRQNGDRESWCYLAGEFGGNSWAVQRSNGANDILSLRDYRLILGIEHVHGEEYRWLVEAGFVFGRKIEYTSGIGNTDQNPTGMIRGGLVF